MNMASPQWKVWREKVIVFSIILLSFSKKTISLEAISKTTYVVNKVHDGLKSINHVNNTL